MIHRARKILSGHIPFGFTLALAVAVASLVGLLDPLERWFYDRRARSCQFFTPPPTDRLVHLDIDDASLDAVGRWAWPRSRLAEIVDEIHVAGPKAIALDVLFPEPQDVRYEPDADGKIEKIEDDRIFADSLQRLNCAVLPLTLEPAARKVITPVQTALNAALGQNLELTEVQASQVLLGQGIEKSDLSHGFLDLFLRARREMMFERILGELHKHSRTPAQLRAALLPNTDRYVQTPAARLLVEQYARATAELALQQCTVPVPATIAPLLQADPDSVLTPVPVLIPAVRSIGFVTYIKESDGTIRRMPLFMEYRGRLYPQFAVALAAIMLDADISQFKFSDRAVTIPRRNGPPVVVPVYTYFSDTLNRPAPMMFDIPWIGAPDDGWQTMYDKVGSPHLPINVVWDVCLTRRRIRQNNMQVDDALRFLYQAFAPEKFEPFEKHPLPPEDALCRLDLCRAALADYGVFIDDAEKTNLAEIKDANERAATERLAAQGRALRHVISENPMLKSQLDAQRQNLRARFAGRAILVGWTATAQAADKATTSIHGKCPGVVIHGTIFNAIMTGHFWRHVPRWVDVAVFLAMSGLAMILASRLTPMLAAISTLLLVAIYAVINGVLVFDWGNRIMGAAAPIVAAALICAGITVTRFVAELAEHRRIRKRFQSYVDPSLVQYVYEHPELARMEGQVREMTVCFTDVPGFTSLAEELKERAVALLGRYFSRMVPIIRRHRGFVHCFMGDGLMFSFGAPKENPNHAIDAVNTVLEIYPAIDAFNRELAAEGYPKLGVRAGVSTGDVVVGDTGGDDACDYTCLGDVANFGARLESANKAMGTKILISARTAELIGDRFLLREIGCLRVAGKKKGVMVYEPLGTAESATPEQQTLARMTREMVDHYLGARFEECLLAADSLDEAFGPSKLTRIYRDGCNSHLAAQTVEFDGHLVLDHK